jgi:hypothetical protein
MLKVIYYYYFHSIMSYGIIFWGHSAGSMRHPITTTLHFRITGHQKLIPEHSRKRNQNNHKKRAKTEQYRPPNTAELLQLYDVITKQNYFTNNNDIIIQHDGLAMGAPSFSLIAKIFLQHIEH